MMRGRGRRGSCGCRAARRVTIGAVDAFIKRSGTYMEWEPETWLPIEERARRTHYTTREGGDIMEGWPGARDMGHAVELAVAIQREFGSAVQVETYTAGEWVALTVEVLPAQ